jgi:hypothetical protein
MIQPLTAPRLSHLLPAWCVSPVAVFSLIPACPRARATSCFRVTIRYCLQGVCPVMHTSGSADPGTGSGCSRRNCGDSRSSAVSEGDNWHCQGRRLTTYGQLLSTAVVPQVLRSAYIGQSGIAVPNCTAAVSGRVVTPMMPIPLANDARVVKGWLQLQASTIRVNLSGRCGMAAVISRAIESSLAASTQR